MDFTDPQKEESLTLEKALHYFDYNPQTGSLKWKSQPSSKTHIGTEAGTLNRNGYILVGFEKKYYLAHRLAWLIAHGCWPKLVLDHINGKSTDNRIENLRECTFANNMKNQRLSKSNKSGVKGVHWNSSKRKWIAKIGVSYKEKTIGSYNSLEDAKTAVIQARTALHGEFANHG